MNMAKKKTENRLMRTSFMILTFIIAIGFASCHDHAVYEKVIEIAADVGAFSGPEYVLHSAIYENNYQAVAEYIREGHDVNKIALLEPGKLDQYDWTDKVPLGMALGSGKKSYDIVKLLVSSGADVNHIGSQGLSYLADAAMRGDKELADFLLENGADIDLKEENEYSVTPIEVMITSGIDGVFEWMFPYLISKGAKVTNESLQIALGYRKEVDINDTAAQYHVARRVLEYLKGQNTQIDIDPILEAAITGNKDIVMGGIDAGKVSVGHDKDILFFSAAYGDVDTLKSLFDYGYRPDEVDMRGNSLLHIAAMYNTKGVVDYLIDEQMSMNEFMSLDNVRMQSPLTVAAVAGNYETADALLNRGEKWTEGFDGDSLIEVLIYGSADSLEYLMDHGYPKDKDLYETAISNLQPYIIYSYGSTELDKCKIMIDKKAPYDWRGYPGDNIELHLFLFEQGLENVDKTLLVACAMRQSEVVKQLLEGGALDAKEDYLWKSINVGDLESTKLLVENGADVNHVYAGKYEGNETPLIVAARQPSGDVIRFLVESGADIHAKDDDGKTAYDWAKDMHMFDKRPEVLELLK
jgi:ankyrin repeat protein